MNEAHDFLTRAKSWLPDETTCRTAALAAAGGTVEEGATWPYLWPGGLRLAADLEQLLPSSLEARRALHVVDLGCGRGLLGMAALALGCEWVTFADGDPLPLGLLKSCLQAFPRASCQLVNWGEAIPGPAAELILGGDVLYRPEYHRHLMVTIAASLTAHGKALLGDPRSRLEDHLATLAEQTGCLLSIEARPGPYSLCTITQSCWDRIRPNSGIIPS